MRPQQLLKLLPSNNRGDTHRLLPDNMNHTENKVSTVAMGMCLLSHCVDNRGGIYEEWH
jgi:hypothetical protein